MLDIDVVPLQVFPLVHEPVMTTTEQRQPGYRTQVKKIMEISLYKTLQETRLQDTVATF